MKNLFGVGTIEVVIREPLEAELEDLLSLYFDFYRELRSLQGWSPHSIEEYKEELNKMLVRDKFLVAASSEDGLVGFL